MEYTAAQIGEVKYDTLAEAIEAAGKSDIITLMTNISESITIGKEITIAYNSFTVKGYTIAPEYCESISSTASQLVIKQALYKLTNTNGVFYSDADFYDIVTEAKGTAGSVVLLLQDVNYTSSEPMYIQSSITIDLGSHTLNITQGIAAKSAEFRVEMADLLTVMNGTINVTNSSAYSLFKFDAEGAQLSVIGLDITAGNMFYNTYANVTVNIIDSTFNLTKVSGNRFITSTNSIAFTATNSKIYLSTNTLIMSQAGAGATADNYHSTFNFTNCDIYREGMNTSNNAERANIFTCNNGYTYTTFTGCNIVGSIKPATNSTQVNNKIPAATAANVILGKGTTISADSAYVATPANNCSLVTDTGEYTFTILGVSITYTKGTVVDYRLVTIKWYCEDGKTIFTTTEAELYNVGIEAPEYTPGSSNGWFTTTFDGWTTVFGSTNKVDLATYVVEGEVSFYPAIKSDTPPTAHLKNGEYNLTLTGNIAINFYLPEIPEGITITGVFMADGETEIVGKNVILPNGDFRTMYVVDTVGATALTESVVIKVKFTVTQNGTEYPLTQTITLSPYKYAVSVLKSDAHSPETHTLIADMVRYSNLLSVAANGATVAELDALLETYGKHCSALPSDNDFGKFTTSINALEGYISTISLEVSKYQPRWKFTFTEAMKITDVKLTLNGYFELPDENGKNYGSLTYNLNTADSTKSNGYYTTVYMESIPMYNVDRDITITVTTEDGTQKSGTYSLNCYYANMNATGETLANAREFLKAFRAFGISSAGYRYPDGIKSAATPTKDFFDCTHDTVTKRSLSKDNDATGIHCTECDTYVFFYEVYVKNMFTSAAMFKTHDEAYDAKLNVYKGIYRTHAKANAAAAQGKKVGVYADSFYYYLSLSQLDSNLGSITVQTDTNWEGACFIVDDRDFNVTDATYNHPIFSVRSQNNVTAPDETVIPWGGLDITQDIVAAHGTQSRERVITPGMTNIGWSCGMPVLVELIDYSQSRYHREGANASKASTHEVILIDEFGNVNSTTPIEWDYVYIPNWNKTSPADDGKDDAEIKECSFQAIAHPINSETIRLSGLDANGKASCVFETLPNETTIDVSEYNACSRGIQIRRSNVIVEGLEHKMLEDDSNTTPRQAYDGFIRILYSNNTIVRDMVLDQHIRHYVQENGENTSVYLGSYELSGNLSINTSFINCNMRDFFEEDGSVTYGGMFGTKLMRNTYVKNSVIRSYDSHTGAYNVTIEDSTLEHLTLIGAGDIILKNVVVYVDGGFGGIQLRADYGSRWEGNVYIDGLDLRHSTSYSKDYVDLIRAEYRNHDFSYKDTTATSGNYLPFEIYAKNVTINTYTRTEQAYTCTTPGIVDEVLTKSTVKLGIYAYYNETLNSNYTFSFLDDNKQTVTQAIYFEGGHIDSIDDLKLPTHSKLKSIVIKINGDKQNWT